MCVCVTGSFRRTFISIHSPDIYLFAIHETVRLQNHLNVAMPRKGGLWKMKGTKNHNQNTVLTLNIAENGPKKKTYHNTHAATVAMVAMVACSLQILHKREKIRTWDLWRIFRLLHYIRFARMLGAVLSFNVLCGVWRKVGVAAKWNRTWNTKTQSNTKKLCKI